MHLLFAKAIAATMQGHNKYNYLLNSEARAQIDAERAALLERILKLADSVARYRAFLDGAVIEVRAGQRVADYLVDSAQEKAKATVSIVKADVDAVLPGGAVSIWADKPLSRVLSAGRQATIRFGRLAASKIRSLPANERFDFRDTTASALEKATDLLDQLVTTEKNDVESQRLPLRSAVEADIFALRDFLVKMNGRLIQQLSQSFVDNLYPELRRDRKSFAEDVDDEVEHPTPSEPSAPPPA